MTSDPTTRGQELSEAVHSGDADAVVRLLRAGVPAEAADAEGRTALHLAASGDDPAIVRLLLAAGADPGRGSGEDGDELPLCGAACWGRTEVVRALLAAGAPADQKEGGGFTALTWAVLNGFADTVAALLEYGADPSLPGPSGEPPLVTAARRGSPSVVRALLAHGAAGRREALAEARRWIDVDPEQALRESIAETWGPGHETVTRRVEEDGGVTVVVELLRDGVPRGGQERQTGHAAVATLLEAVSGVAAPPETLAGRALRWGAPERDDWTEAVAALRGRGDEETFRAAVAWCASDDPLRQAFGADVLARLGFSGGRRPFAARALPLLRELAREAVDAEPVSAVVGALGDQGDPAALPELLRHAGHPDPAVRRRVALALTGLVPEGHDEGVRALMALSGDREARVRVPATRALAEAPDASSAVREALAARLDDPDGDTAAEAARGLARRQDVRAVDVLERILGGPQPDGPARAVALAALEHVRDESARRRLEHTLPRRR
ncbi:ankyrin repeat domain-containing protein [Streptomyces sp. SP18CS02]|uniref:ankyrin repeat domain-containing protein n=1 Tax=Streptomyces sp. SP18CS02 TaxID=3002531 RepID=UPI002E79B589|nr:ankyrin repeat domain-containing protein [Streptomyces sp. SP18CS02]MEE1754994.1 ankyrin repeat domain-containing protein [Streptomyces sp. SP18CS02]